MALKGETHTYREFVSIYLQRFSEGNRLHLVKTKMDESFDGFLFYLNRRVIYHLPEDPVVKPGIYLARKSWVEKQPEEFQRKAQVIIQGGRRIDEDHERLILFRFFG